MENKPFNPPTFENRAGAKSNTDITLTNHLANLAVDGWSVGQGLTTSDHNIIYFDLISKLNRNNERQLKRNFNFKKANWSKLKQSLIVPSDVILGDDIDKKARELSTAIRAAMKHSIPLVVTNVHSTYRPWSDALQKLRGNVRRARRAYQRTRVEANLQGASRQDESREDESPRRESPRRESPRRKSPRRESPRRESPRRESPRRKSPRRESPRLKSPRRLRKCLQVRKVVWGRIPMLLGNRGKGHWIRRKRMCHREGGCRNETSTTSSLRYTQSFPKKS